MTTFKPDLLIKNLDGKPIAIVEVENLPNLSRDEAIEMRRTILEERGLSSNVPYFLLVSQDIGFLWKESRNKGSDTPPDYEFPMDKVITRYSDGSADERLYNSVLEYVILQWLYNLSTKPQETTEEPEKTLAQSGFKDSIKGAMVLLEATL